MVCFGGPDATLVGAITQLDQVAIVQANGGNISICCCIDDASGAGANAQTVDHLGEVGNDFLDWIGAVFDGGHDQVACGLNGHTADGFIASANDHLVNAAGTSFTGFAKTGLHARTVLEFQCHMLHDVARPSAFDQSL